jgi:uncharacterized protein YceH (UPF0502 family)
MDDSSHQPQDYIGFDPAASAPPPEQLRLSPEETRVLGCLIEKSRTTPDDYPLTGNALMRACNQSTSRDPIVNYDQRTIDATVNSLKSSGLLRFVHTTSGRNITRYRHVVDERLGLDDAETAIFGLLMLRGAQTVAELKTRAERLHPFRSLDDVNTTLRSLTVRPEPFAVLLERQPGQKEARWTHVLYGEPLLPSAAPSASAGGTGGGGAAAAARIADLEEQVAALTSALNEVRTELGLDPIATGPAAEGAADGSADI